MSDDFFDPPQPREPQRPEQRYRQPDWAGPPQGELGGVVPVELLIARTESVAVAVLGVRGFSSGFSFELVTLGAPDIEDELDPFDFGPPHRRRGEGLRFGVEFSDGRRATNLGWGPPPARGDGAPPEPVMHSGGGGGGGASWSQETWVWPLPPPGPLTFAVDWKAAGIPLTKREIDAEVVLEASRRAVMLFDYSVLPPWPDPEEGDEPEWVGIR